MTKLSIYKLILFIFCILLIGCNGQKKDTITTTKKIDVEAYKIRKEKDPSRGGFIILEDSTQIHQFGLTKNAGATEIITPPKPSFYKIRKGYFESTNTLEYTGKEIGGMKIGIWQFFDDKGKL